MKSNAALATFGALSQPKRLTLIEKLARAGSLPAGEIARMLRISPPNLSFHLRVLEEAGLLNSERQGRSIFYRVNFSTLDDLVGFVGSLPRNTQGKTKAAGSKARSAAPSKAKGRARAGRRR